MCEYAEVCNTIRRKARKQHECMECLNPIEVGETYAYTSGVFDGRGFSDKRCLDCQRLLTYCSRLPGVECIDTELHEFLRESDFVTRTEEDGEFIISQEPWLIWERNRWVLADECRSPSLEVFP